MMTYEKMKETIRAGGSVTFDGTIYDTIDKLPPEEQFVADKPEQRAALRRKLNQAIEAAKLRLDRLDALPETKMPTSPGVQTALVAKEKEIAELKRKLQEQDDLTNESAVQAKELEEKDKEIAELKKRLAKAEK